MLDIDLVERIDFRPDACTGLGIAESFQREMHRRHHKIILRTLLQYSAEIVLHITDTGVKEVKPVFRISDNIRIFQSIFTCKKIHRRQSFHIRRPCMEHGLVDFIVTHLEPCHHIGKQPVLLLHLRIDFLVHPVFLPEPPLGVSAEQQGKNTVIQTGKRQRHEKILQSSQKHPLYGPVLTETDLLVVIDIFR